VTLTLKDGQEDTLKPKSKIEAPLGFSYHCSTTEVFEGQTAILRLLNPQVSFAGCCLLLHAPQDLFLLKNCPQDLIWKVKVLESCSE